MAQDKQDLLAAQGFQYIELMSGDDLEAEPAAQNALQSWADEAQMTSIPVLDAHLFEHWGPFELDFGTPSITHIGPDMRILSIDEDVEDPQVYMEQP